MSMDWVAIFLTVEKTFDMYPKSVFGKWSWEIKSKKF